MSVIFRGKPACECLAAWLPAFEAELKARRLLAGSLSIFQLIGGAAASAGTHSTGGAFDLVDLVGEEDLWVARQMGADATWSRKAPSFSPPHVHGVLRGCPHNGPARYQIAAVDLNGNGLGSNGMGGADDGPRPLSKRTWQQGIEWQREQAARRTARARITARIAAVRANAKSRVAVLKARRAEL